MITPAVHAAAMALFAVGSALQAKARTNDADELVKLGVTHVQSALSFFTVQDGIRDLGPNDRFIYLAIVGTLRTFVDLGANPSPALNWTRHLQSLRKALMNTHTYLAEFDSDLARAYARDSQTTPPAADTR